MAKKQKSLKKNPETAELGMKGKGVEPLVIPSIERAADRYAAARDERMQYQDVENAARKTLLDEIQAHRAELIQEVGGGVSYRYGDNLITLAGGKEVLKVKKIHDDVDPAGE